MKIVKVFAKTLVVIFFSISLLLVILQNSAVQTHLAKVGSAFLSSKMGIEMSIEKLRISGLLQISLKNVHLKDHHNNPLIFFKKAYIDISMLAGVTEFIHISKLEIDSAYVHLRKYPNEDQLNLINVFVVNDTTEENTQDTLSANPLKIKLDHLKLSSTHFIYEDIDKSDDLNFGIDYADMDISNINLEIKDAKIISDSISANILALAAKEKSGFVLKNFEGNAIVSSSIVKIDDLFIQTVNSDLKLNLRFDYKNWSDYTEFIDNIALTASIAPSKLEMKDLSYFAPTLRGMNDLIRISGQVEGPIRNLKGRELDIAYGSATGFNGRLQIIGLPNIYESFINTNIKSFSTNINDIKSFKLPGEKGFADLPEEIEKLGKIRVKGRFVGFYNDFVSKAEVYTELGKLATNIQFTNNVEEDIIYYNGKLEARDFDLGLFLDNPQEFGEINMDVDVNGKGLSLENIQTEVKGRIDSIVYRKELLNTIFLDAKLEKNAFKGSMSIEDNLINAKFDGSANFDKEESFYDLKGELQDVKLAKLGLLETDSSASLSTSFNINFKGNTIDQIEGSILIDSTTFYYLDQFYFMDSLRIYSLKDTYDPSIKYLNIYSDYMAAHVKGNYNLQELPQSFSSLMVYHLKNIGYPQKIIQPDYSSYQYLDFKIDFFNLSELSDLFLPGLQVEDSVNIIGEYQQNTKEFDLNLNTASVNYNGYKLNQISFASKSTANAAEVVLDVGNLNLKEPSTEDTLALGMENISIKSNIYDSLGDYSIFWKNKGFPKNEADIRGSFFFDNSKTFVLGMDLFDVKVNNANWNLERKSKILFDSASISFDSLSFMSKEQQLMLNGALAKAETRMFNASFKNFDIAAFNILLKSAGLKLAGKLTGSFELIDVYNNPGFTADMSLKDFELNDEKLGFADINSYWDSDESIFIDLKLNNEGNKGIYQPLSVKGIYYPNNNNEQLNIDVSLQNQSLSFLNPFLESFIADLEGFATGNVKINGTINKPNLKGEINLARTQLRIKYLNTLYSLSGTLNLTNKILAFENVNLYDTTGNQAILSGGLTHNSLKDFGIDLKLIPEKFVALNTTAGMNELFYGNAVVSGEIAIIGPFDNIFLDIKAKTERGTDLKIPISNTLDVSENRFIIFVNSEDTTTQEANQNFVPELSSFSLNMEINISNSAKVELFLPSDIGEIQSRGSGELNMSLSRTGNFRMSGDYRVSDGLFFFRIGNLLNRRFDLNEGGRISWTGDPYTGELNMSANYQLKTSLNSLGLEQDSSFRNRVPVNCRIGLSGPIMDPSLKFNFDLPKSTEEVKQFVYTKIDTTNPSEMSQQMLSLLVFNSFSFNSGANNSLGSSVSGSSFQIVANQVSNWLSQISRNVDIGINYRPGNDLTNEELEVALSTQLFDERVTIDGNFGYQNAQNNPNTNTSGIVGDINVEVKLTNDGRLRLKAFNRTNTVDLLDNTSPYTQGVGIFYRKEFNSLKELFTNQRKEQREKEEAAKLRAKALKPDEKEKKDTNQK
jgi:hypothetical protein